MGKYRKSVWTWIACLWLCVVTVPLAAQDYSLTATSTSGMSGSMVTIDVLMNNVMPVRGLTLGLAHDGSVATLNTIVEGPATLATNGGMGADFLFVDETPANGPGGIFGIVISTEAPIEEIPAGIGQSVAQFTYTLVGDAGDTTSLDFSSMLGNPPVLTVLSVAGVSFIPVQNSGSLLVETPPVQNLNCTLTDACTCEATITWTNPVVYDLVRVYVDGVLAATTPGTSATVTLPVGSPADVCVIGEAQGTDSVSTCCSITCPTIPPAAPPTGLMCTIDDITCIAMMTWTNPETYTAIAIQVDGATVQTLSGTATSATVDLMNAGTYQLCVVATEMCGGLVAPTCCNVTCAGPPPQFVRGDANQDMTIDVSDPVLMLAVLFLGATTTCDLAIDVDDSDGLTLLDVMMLLGYIFGTGGPPAAPFPACGDDVTPGMLGCVSSACP